MSIYEANKPIIYKITYLPWEANNDGNPYMYIGSTSRDLDIYFGSVSSKKWKKFWKEEVRKNPDNFKKEVLAVCLSDDRKNMLELEYEIQTQYDVVKSKDYFNMSFAHLNGPCGCVMVGEENPMWGKKFNEEHRKNMSNGLKRFHNEHPEHLEIMREISIEVQNRQEVKEKKRLSQKKQWESNPNLQNSRNTQFRPKKVLLKDIGFTHVKEFSNWLKENSFISIGCIRGKDWSLWSTQDIKIATELAWSLVKIPNKRYDEIILGGNKNDNIIPRIMELHKYLMESDNTELKSRFERFL